MKFLYLCVCVFAICLAGCEAGGASVTGKVTAGGEKVTSGNVTFSPVGGGHQPQTAILKDDGTYSVSKAAVGKNKVVFSPSSSTDAVVLKPGESAKPSAYSGYTVTMEEVEIKAGSNTIDIDLAAPK